MKTMMRILFAATVLLMAGCKTTEEVKPVTWKEQSAYLSKVKDPRWFGYSIYDTPAGIEYRGGCRLHPNQVAELPMKAEEPLRPVGLLRGNFGFEAPLLFDFTSPVSWMEFNLARKLGAQPVGEGKALLVKMPGEDVIGCQSALSTLRLDQLFIENPLVYVRMANGPIGSLARGIEDPAVKGVIGWDLLKKFEQVYLDYAGKRVVIATAEVEYSPNPALVVAKIPLIKHAGVCAVRGAIDGKSGLILIDPAGDFEVATDGGAAVSAIQLDVGLTFSDPVVSVSPGGTRIGARLLQKYKVAIFPQTGLIYFENPDPADAE